MDKFLMICHVCVDFIGDSGLVFQITPKNRGTFVEAPLWIKETLIYKMLINDGSIIIADESNKKKLENAPDEGILADGKKEDPAEESTDEAPVEVTVKTRKRKAAGSK